MVNKKRFILAVSVVFLSGCVSTQSSQQSSPSLQNTKSIEETGTAQAVERAEPVLPPIDPKADALLKRMGDFLASKSSMSFQAIIVKEQVLPTDQKLQYDANVAVKMRRPDGIFAETVSGAKQKRFWYNGNSFSLLDFRHNLYATTAAPPGIDSALDYAMEEYGVAMPLSDFVFSDPYTVMSENNVSGFYVALTEVNGIKAHHLAFRQPNVDWQIWINAEGDPTPAKFVISYVTHPSVPQYMAFLKDWNFEPKFKPETFVFVPPADSAKIEFSLKSTAMPEEVMK